MPTTNAVNSRRHTQDTGPAWTRVFGESPMPSIGLAVVAIWVAILVASLYAPAMITGSNHEQLAIVAMADWIWGGVATALILLAGAVSPRNRAGVWPMTALILVAIWAIVALVSVFAPTFVTGTDPTTIPLAAMLAPVAGLTITAFLSVFAAGSGANAADR
jgi:hypothetical protein